MIVADTIEQGSPEWFDARMGIPTASNFFRILTPTGKVAKTKYIYELAEEKITGEQNEGFASEYMKRGTAIEPEARRFYEFFKNIKVFTIGLCWHDESKKVSASPDGLIPAIKKGLEIKCPKLSTHLKYLDDGILPTQYIPQVQGSLYVTGYDTWDFLSYYPGQDPLLLTIERDEKYIENLRTAIHGFNEKLNKIVEERTNGRS